MLARRNVRPGFWLVFWREIGWLRRRPSLFGLTTIVPLAQLAFLAANTAADRPGKGKMLQKTNKPSLLEIFASGFS